MTTNLTDSRVVTTDELNRLIDTARTHAFNRVPAGLDLDPEANHLLSVALPFHDRGYRPPGGGPDPVHHRVTLLAKVRGTWEPVETFIDITDSDLSGLLTYRQYMEIEEALA